MYAASLFVKGLNEVLCIVRSVEVGLQWIPNENPSSRSSGAGSSGNRKYQSLINKRNSLRCWIGPVHTQKCHRRKLTISNEMRILSELGGGGVIDEKRILQLVIFLNQISRYLGNLSKVIERYETTERISKPLL